MKHWALVLALALAGCATTPAKGEVRRCPGSSTVLCLTHETCSWDGVAGCMMCVCDSAFGPTPTGGMPASAIPQP